MPITASPDAPEAAARHSEQGDSVVSSARLVITNLDADEDQAAVVSTADLPRLDELEALERVLECYLDQYLCLIGASAIARRYVREQLAGGTWALRANVLGAERFGEMRQILAGEGMGGEFVHRARELPERWVPEDPEGMVRALVVRATRTRGDVDRARELG